jgi:hypothetical protein
VANVVATPYVPKTNNPDPEKNQERTPEELPGKFRKEDTQTGHYQYGGDY